MTREQAADLIGSAVGRAVMEMVGQMAHAGGIIGEADHRWEGVKLEVDGGTLTIGEMRLTVRQVDEDIDPERAELERDPDPLPLMATYTTLPAEQPREGGES